MKKIIIFSIVTLLCSAGAYAQQQGQGSGLKFETKKINEIKKQAERTKEEKEKERSTLRKAADELNKQNSSQNGVAPSEEPQIELYEINSEESNQKDVQQIDLLNNLKEDAERKKKEEDVAKKQKELDDLYQAGLAKYDEVEEADKKRKQYNAAGKSEKDIEDDLEKLDREYYDLQWEYDSIKLKYNELVKEYIPS